MEKLFCVLILNLILVASHSQEYTTTDSILNNQVRATNGICREIKKLTKEVSGIGKNLNKRDSIVLNTIIENVNEVSNLNENYDSIINQITGITERVNKEKDGFNFEDFLSGALAEMIGAFIGAGAAIWIFFRQTKKEKEKDQQQEQKELNEKNHYLSSLLQSSISLVRKQNEGIKKFCEELDSNLLYIPLIPIYSKQDLERLSKVIDNADYYHAFLNKYGSGIENVKKYRGIANSVDFLNNHINQIFDMQDKKLMFDRERKIKYKDFFDRARDNAAELGMKNIESNPELYKSIGEVLQEYYRGLTNSFSLEYHHEKLVTPLRTKLLEKFSDIPETRQILNDLKNANLIYSAIRDHNKIHSDELKKSYKDINRAIEFLEKDGKELIAELQNGNDAIS